MNISQSKKVFFSKSNILHSLCSFPGQNVLVLKHRFIFITLPANRTSCEISVVLSFVTVIMIL